MKQLTFVTVCMGRLDFLRQTLSLLACQPHCASVLVDWSCPQRCGDWAQEHCPGVRVLRVPGHAAVNVGAARNRGAELAGTPWLCFIDADIVIDECFAATLLPHVRPGCYYRPQPHETGICGTWLVTADDFRRAGGYDEVLCCYGDDDWDVFDAMRFGGCQECYYPAALLHHLPHDNDLRTRLFAYRNYNWGHCINRIYRVLKWEMARGRGSTLPRDERQALYDHLFAAVPAAVPQNPVTSGFALEDILECTAAEWARLMQQPASPEARQQLRHLLLQS